MHMIPHVMPSNTTSAVVTADSWDPLTFWGTVAQIRGPVQESENPLAPSSFLLPLPRRMAYAVMQSLLSTLVRSKAGRARLRLSGTCSAFERWRQHTHTTQKAALQAQLEEAQVARREAEAKTAKLKVLLARTHQQSKQHAEDVSAVRKAQATATAESQAQAAQREMLLEQMRAAEAASAFQEDIELRIQRAADAVAAEHALRVQLQQQAIPVLEREVPIEPTAESSLLLQQLQQQLQQQVSERVRADAELQTLRSQYARAVQQHEVQVQSVQQLLQEQQRLCQEQELELSMTAGNGSRTLQAAEALWSQRLQQEQAATRVMAQQLQQERMQQEQEQQRLCRALEAAHAEAAKLRTANAALLRQQGPTNGRGVAYRDVAAVTAMRVGNLRELQRQSGKQTVASETETALRLQGQKVVQLARECATRLRNSQAEAAACRNGWHGLLYRLLQLSEAKVSAAPKCDRGQSLQTQCQQWQQRLLEEELQSKPRGGEQVSPFDGANLVQRCESVTLALQELCSTNSLPGNRHADSENARDASTPVSAVTQSEQFELVDTLSAKVSIGASKSLLVPVHYKRYPPPLRLRWTIQLQGNSSGKDIGFSVIRLCRDGSMPQLFPYRRVTGTFTDEQVIQNLLLPLGKSESDNADEMGVALLLDNAYSWVNGKELQYSCEVYSLGQHMPSNSSHSTTSLCDSDDKIAGFGSKVVDEMSAVDVHSNPKPVLDASSKDIEQILQLLEDSLHFAYTND